MVNVTRPHCSAWDNPAWSFFVLRPAQSPLKLISARREIQRVSAGPR